MKINKMTEESIGEVSQMLKALSDPTRLKIMQTLHHEELCVTDIVEKVGSGQANISKHLQVLAKVNLVQTRREGTTIYYSILDPVVNKMCEAICNGYAKLIEKKYKHLTRRK